MALQIDPIDQSLRATLHRARTWPYHIYPTAAAGSSAMPDPFPDGALPWPPFDRKRHIRAGRHSTSSDPWLTHNYLPAEQQGRFWIERQGPEGDPVGPPQLTLAFWNKAPILEGATPEPCIGGKDEKGEWFKGQIGLRQNRTGETVIGPPRLNLYALFPYNSPTGTLWARAQNYADMPQADQYRYFVLFPVYPHSAWESYPCYPDCVPYPVGAHNDFAFNDTHTYEVPCYNRTGGPPNANWRHIETPTLEPKVEPGLRAIIAQDSAEPQLSVLHWYHFLGADCDDDPYGMWPYRMIENFIRRHKGRTATTRYRWTDDPQNRGWWVEYTAFVNSWFAHNYAWTWNLCAEGSGDPSEKCWWRWNMWYEGFVQMRHNGDLGVPGFYNFIAGQDSRFGLRFEPRNPVCNDCFAECAGLTKALGDIVLPSQACQEGIGQFGGQGETPCLRDTGTPSMWYVPEPPLGGSIAPSSHPITEEPAYPEVPLMHEIKRTMLAADGSDGEVQYGWAQAAFTTTVPSLTSAEG